MLQIIITALLALGFISNADEATPEIHNQYQIEVDEYIIGTDHDQI